MSNVFFVADKCIVVDGIMCIYWSMMTRFAYSKKCLYIKFKLFSKCFIILINNDHLIRVTGLLHGKIIIAINHTYSLTVILPYDHETLVW